MGKTKVPSSKYKALKEFIDYVMSDWDSEHVLYEEVDDDYMDVYIWSDYEEHESYISFRFSSKGELEMLDGPVDSDNWVAKDQRYSDWDVLFWRNAYFNK